MSTFTLPLPLSSPPSPARGHKLHLSKKDHGTQPQQQQDLSKAAHVGRYSCVTLSFLPSFQSRTCTTGPISEDASQS
eukprot:96425-Pelagomonas_calceolata.AAC.7